MQSSKSMDNLCMEENTKSQISTAPVGNGSAVTLRSLASGGLKTTQIWPFHLDGWGGGGHQSEWSFISTVNPYYNHPIKTTTLLLWPVIFLKKSIQVYQDSVDSLQSA